MWGTQVQSIEIGEPSIGCSCDGRWRSLRDDDSCPDTSRPNNGANEETAGETQAPLMKLERALHIPSAFVVMRLFALSNAGLALVFPQRAVASDSAAWLGGIGFTTSLFVPTLAFEGQELLGSAKLGIVTGLLIAGVTGALMLRVSRWTTGRLPATHLNARIRTG
jgi:hypothetical protein